MMIRAGLKHKSIRVCCLLAAAMLVCWAWILCGEGGLAQESIQETFASAEDAAQALADACAADDVGRIRAILGPAGNVLISSGDEVADRASRELLARAFHDKHQLVAEGADKQILHLGVEDWPVPVPIVKLGDRWQFDTREGRAELLRRRTEGNEATALRVCRLYVELQNQYGQTFSDPNTFKPLYAQKFMSDPGKHNGLYWDAKGGGRRSPADAVVQLAMQDGYQAPGRRPRPFHGYYFKVLTAQGKDAPGGEKTYFDTSDTGLLAERKMTGGFALVAFPAKYQASGVLTFIVNQDGIVYQQDLGEATQDVALEMTEYNPDSSWTRVY